MPPPARTPLRSATACPPPGTLGHGSAPAISPEAEPGYVSAMRRTPSPRRDVEQIQPRTRRRLPCLGRTIRAVPSNPMEVYFDAQYVVLPASGADRADLSHLRICERRWRRLSANQCLIRSADRRLCLSPRDPKPEFPRSHRALGFRIADGLHSRPLFAPSSG